MKAILSVLASSSLLAVTASAAVYDLTTNSSVAVNTIYSTATSMISLDSIKLFTSDVANQNTTNVESLGVKRFDIDLPNDSYIKYNDYNSGSGEGDIMFFIPTTAFFTDGFLGQQAADIND